MLRYLDDKYLQALMTAAIKSTVKPIPNEETSRIIKTNAVHTVKKIIIN